MQKTKWLVIQACKPEVQRVAADHATNLLGIDQVAGPHQACTSSCPSPSWWCTPQRTPRAIRDEQKLVWPLHHRQRQEAAHHSASFRRHPREKAPPPNTSASAGSNPSRRLDIGVSTVLSRGAGRSLDAGRGSRARPLLELVL